VLVIPSRVLRPERLSAIAWWSPRSRAGERPDFHRQATTSLRTRRNTMALRHSVTSRSAGARIVEATVTRSPDLPAVSIANTRLSPKVGVYDVSPFLGVGHLSIEAR
jgi:hypothetical protein